jgi:UDP-N-acetylglucosamine 3-dehydrogenase
MKLRVGLIGCGKIARMHAQGFQTASDLAEVVVCCDERKEIAQAMALSLGYAKAVTRWQDVVEREDIDVVDVCLPHYLHAPVVIAAAQAKKHVLVEKPFATNLAEAIAMVNAADQAGTVLMVGQHQRYGSDHRHIKALLDRGVIGRVLAVRVDSNQFLSDYYPSGHWLFSKAQAGGGIVISVAVHKIDLLRYLLGEIRRVASFQSISGLNVGMEGEDIAAISLEFENGTVGEGFFTFAARHRPIPVTIYPFELFILYGEEGMIHNIQGWHVYSTKVKEYSNGPTRLDIPSQEYAEWFDYEIWHFLECIETGAEPISSGRDNLGTMAVLEAIYQSAKTGQVVGVPRHILEEY